MLVQRLKRGEKDKPCGWQEAGGVSMAESMVNRVLEDGKCN